MQILPKMKIEMKGEKILNVNSLQMEEGWILSCLCHTEK